MKKTLVSLFTLVALSIGAQSFAACPCTGLSSYGYSGFYGNNNLYRYNNTCGCPIAQPCCPAAPCPKPCCSPCAQPCCPAAPCPKPCCSPCAQPCPACPCPQPCCPAAPCPMPCCD